MNAMEFNELLGTFLLAFFLILLCFGGQGIVKGFFWLKAKASRKRHA